MDVAIKKFPLLMAAFLVLFAWLSHEVDSPTAFYRAIPDYVPVTAHSHNDYEQEMPLWDALANRIYSVEADVWLHSGSLMLSHYGVFFRGKLKDLYLDPLQKRVDEMGSVYGDNKNFMLWIELKETNPQLLLRLHHLLSKYSMLSRFTDSKFMPGPVTVILTGIEEAKRAYADCFKLRYATRDRHEISAEDPPADNRWDWYTLKWTDIFAWRGEGAMPSAEIEKLRQLTALAHSKGRRLRFWNVPDNEDSWSEAMRAGVDLINTDRLEAISRFLGAHTPPLEHLVSR